MRLPNSTSSGSTWRDSRARPTSRAAPCSWQRRPCTKSSSLSEARQAWTFRDFEHKGSYGASGLAKQRGSPSSSSGSRGEEGLLAVMQKTSSRPNN
ncbi:hypothetical protein NL676_003609 [Syzygium grande]|nr:hypothetical protein NL676_003609 [Syzygium grande]